MAVQMDRVSLREWNKVDVWILVHKLIQGTNVPVDQAFLLSLFLQLDQSSVVIDVSQLEVVLLVLALLGGLICRNFTWQLLFECLKLQVFNSTVCFCFLVVIAGFCVFSSNKPGKVWVPSEDKKLTKERKAAAAISQPTSIS